MPPRLVRRCPIWEPTPEIRIESQLLSWKHTPQELVVVRHANAPMIAQPPTNHHPGDPLPPPPRTHRRRRRRWHTGRRSVAPSTMNTAPIGFPQIVSQIGCFLSRLFSYCVRNRPQFPCGFQPQAILAPGCSYLGDCGPKVITRTPWGTATGPPTPTPSGVVYPILHDAEEIPIVPAAAAAHTQGPSPVVFEASWPFGFGFGSRGAPLFAFGAPFPPVSN